MIYVCVLTLIVTVIAPVQLVQSLEDIPKTLQHVARVKKRSYSPFTFRNNPLSLYNAGNVFKPATYSISRPYYIPVYGVPGNLIFYPPQPIYVNPGTPQDNPVKPMYHGPSYLPPKETTPMQTMNRFGEDEDDDAPIWGNGGMVQMPLSNGQNKEWSVPPTRPPKSTTPGSPPLVHDQSNSQSTQRPSAQSAQSSAGAESSIQSGPSNCVWAIISCCSTASPNALPQNCFEQRGCPGPFWDASPCNSDYARSAIAAAVNYYNSNQGATSGK